MKQIRKQKRRRKKQFTIDDYRKPDEILETQGFWIANLPMFSSDPKNPRSKHGRYIIAYPILSEDLKTTIYNKLVSIPGRFQRIKYKSGMIYTETRKNKDYIFIPPPNYFDLENKEDES